MRYPFIKLPRKVEMALFLIREELKTRKFFNGLAKVGLHDCPSQTFLGALIADQLGLDIHSDEAFTQFDNILEKYSKKVEDADNESIMKVVMKVYVHLMNSRKSTHDEVSPH